jgi:exo-beta-1,3-glucanase (GH17 family)
VFIADSAFVPDRTKAVASVTRKIARVTEAGWPTAGEPCCKINAPGFPRNASYLAVPSQKNAAIFLNTTETLSIRTGITVFHFQASAAQCIIGAFVP